MFKIREKNGIQNMWEKNIQKIFETQMYKQLS